jgi:signal peptidase I
MNSVTIKEESVVKMINTAKRFIEVIKEPALAVLAAFMISSFIVSHTMIPTGSMISTIMPKDHLIINRIPYYYRNPEIGEIVVFKENGENLIKRVVAKAGDEIDIVDGYVYINKIKIDESSYVFEDGHTYLYTSSDIEYPYIIPEGYYFLLGDNRMESADSRLFGPISRDQISAKAVFRIYPFNRIGIVR